VRRRGGDSARARSPAPAHLTADEVAAARIAATWCDAHRPPELALDPAPSRARLAAFAAGVGRAPAIA
jgi:hypothetical protein